MRGDWSDFRYLRQGTPGQKSAYETLHRLGIFEGLAAYHPLLVGTVPIDLDIQGSDLDIACEVDGLDHFEQHLMSLYSFMPAFAVRRTIKFGDPAVVGDFEYNDFAIQVFGQTVPVRAQRAYVHMVVEARLLDLAGSAARESIRALKVGGMKTEPAFAAYFQLSGDPYEVLCDLAGASDSFLLEIVARSGRA